MFRLRNDSEIVMIKGFLLNDININKILSDLHSNKCLLLFCDDIKILNNSRTYISV